MRVVKITYLIVSIVIVGCAKIVKKPPTYSEGIVPPILREELEPEYPVEAKQQGLEGSTEMYLFISDSGQVLRARIAKSSGSKVLDEAALQYAKQLRFYPAQKGGNPTRAWLTWNVNYKLELKQPVFVPEDFFQELQKQLRIAEQTRGEERSHLLQAILYKAEKYVGMLNNEPRRNLNAYVRDFVLSEVYDWWQDFWLERPLRFVLFHDFAKRFSQSELAEAAVRRMVAVMKEDFEQIKKVTPSEAQLKLQDKHFLSTIYRFLKQEYPRDLTEEFKSRLEEYLKEQNNDEDQSS